ncbi:RagB/SusD family nutrient uptake outer membrane protein [Segatella bryantii]|uniref:RagB/SusD family nutrient uptake outer membrane protein n=1 Tax=Segatella bryantii TaxID=77095 RepID=A0ABX4EL84_SEGBR|nr:RagB/SusD family nutrient uptake outer membrane protein [Segatella bryantii]MDR4930617.1 RagB/SusD family nutrient uptake outer membrane protein [Segatella bryantii]OYP56157.1 RagB/SusD family nutrient uptake outer membrane protein [Segatella bryantii]UKK76609.1 RagB/SusD family nutrient uptake outer membrane protein [Segatella bryantii]UKK81250.1 RagB/SusD family nutrient uptake outer membrane protein [Segatella bryantii]
MKLNKNILCLALASLALSSCNTDYNEYTAYDKEYIARSFTYVGGLMTKIYNDIDTDWGNLSGAMLSSATDESEYSHDGNSVEDFYNGNWSAANPHQTIWSSAYEGITYCNEVIDNWSDMTFDQYKLNIDYEKQMYLYNNYKYEARWARAYFYYTLVRQYGGVPFKIHNTTGTEETALPRVTADSIFNFIASECDDIKDKIIEDYSADAEHILAKAETGRANKYAVLALKAQAALYQASPLFTQGKTDEEKKNLWAAAVIANKELIDEAEKKGYGLASSIDALWGKEYYSEAQSYKEIIWARRTASANTFESYNFPVGYSSGQGGNCPTQDLVDAFECTDGKSISESSLYDPNNPYANRDSRLAKTVVVNGEAWPNDLAAYNSEHPTIETYVGGFHSRTGNAAGKSYATTTGYYLKKFCNPDQILRARSGVAVTTSPHGWLTFRMGGMYLNYAEALFQYFKIAGNANAADATAMVTYTDPQGDKHTVTIPSTQTAAKMASMTRTRSGMPAFAAGMTNDEFWSKYKNERRVELAFEGHRFYDVRRWMEDGDKFMNIHRMEITKNENGSFTYNKVAFTRGDGKWQSRWNLFPFSQTEIMKSGNAIVQNPGW